MCVDKICVVCGKVFQNKQNHHAVTCGPACRRVRHNEVARIHNKNKRAKRIPKQVKCVICGASFPKKGLTKTCSETCWRTLKNNKARRQSAKRRLERVKYAECVVCGKTFRKVNSAKTCSQECSIDYKTYGANGKPVLKPKSTEYLCVISVEDYFDASMYRTNVKLSKVKNGWHCRKCGVELTGNHRFFCELCHSGMSENVIM